MALPDVSPTRAIHAPEWAPEMLGILTGGNTNPAFLEDLNERWKITDRGSAEWAMGMYADLVKRAREISAQATEWRFPIDQWEGDELARLNPGIRFFLDHLERYALEQRAVTGEATVRLPSGQIPTRAAQHPVVQVEDEETVIRWLYEHAKSELYSQAVKTEPELRGIMALRGITATRAAKIPQCAECGFPIEQRVDPFDENVTVWEHSVPVETGPDDEPHDAEPADGWEVVLRSEVVPFCRTCGAELSHDGKLWTHANDGINETLGHEPQDHEPVPVSDGSPAPDAEPIPGLVGTLPPAVALPIKLT